MKVWLYDELRQCADDLAQAIHAARTEATRQGIVPDQALTRDGTPILGPMLAARAHVLVALAAVDAES